MLERPVSRPIEQNLWIIAAIIACIILLGVTAGVIALSRRQQAVNVLIVPDDYATIQQAIDAAETADIIQVRAGIYNENLIMNKPVSLTAETFDQINPANNTVIINGGTGTAAITIPENLTQMPSIRGFVIQGGNNGILASSQFVADSNFFRSSAIAVNYQWGAGGSNRNNIYFQPSDDAIHMDSTAVPLLIENNRIMYAGDDGIEVNLQSKPYPPGAVEVNIWNNMIIGSREDGIQIVDFSEDPQDTNRRIIVVGNLIANSAKAGIGLMPNANTVEDFSGADTAEAVQVFNNTFYGNNQGISGGDNLVAFNNIIVNSTGRGVWKVQGPSGANSIVAYTLFFNNAIDADQTTMGVGIITGQDPLFVAAPNPGMDGAWETVDDDFSGLLLQGSSPAIDRGVTQYIAVDGRAIPANPLTGFIGTAPDLGWREFGSPIIITPTASAIPSPTSATLTASPTFTPITPTATVVTITSVPSVTVAPASPTVPVPTVTVLPSSTTVAVTATSSPVILNVTPNTASANATVNLTITGSGFVNGAVVSFEGGQGTPPQVASAQVVNPTTIVITVNTQVDTGSVTQSWDVRVTNPNNASSVLNDGFTITVTP